MEGGGTTNKASTFELQQPSPAAATPLRKILMVAGIAVGLQFGWALQLSLLTPYVQLLGIPHAWSSFIWLCGPVSGMLVQPIVGYCSDNCSSRFGRRRPFIFAGAAFIVIAVFLIGFAADLGHASGDPLGKTAKPRAISIFVVGFWILDVANNMLQGPCRALLADLSCGDGRKMGIANAAFSFFVAVGNVLGYSAGSYNNLHKIFPFSKTKACDIYCANLKSCFFISITLLLTPTVLALTIVGEPAPPPKSPETANTLEAGCKKGGVKVPFFGELFSASKDLPRPMWILLLVTALNSLAWFPFLLFDTDWMGREVYGGKVGEGKLYDVGVRAGSLGLMLNAVVLGVTSLGLAYLARRIRWVKRIWGVANIFLAVCMAVLTVVITKWAESSRRHVGGVTLPPVPGVKIGALALFTVLGIPLAVMYSVPFTLASIFSSNCGAGQGLSLGVLNLSVVIPQMIVSLTSGPWDSLFGGGNLPAFIMGGVAAAASGILALTLLPSPGSDLKPITTTDGFH